MLVFKVVCVVYGWFDLFGFDLFGFDLVVVDLGCGAWGMPKNRCKGTHNY